MATNRAFWKAIHSLTHPLSILAILVLLMNDHWLRYAYPSWLTGKLGDFTWLLFAPFVAAMLFAFIIPKTLKNQSKIVGIIAIAGIGLWFATAKTIPAIHWLTTETLYAIIGYRGSLRMDVTDLLTLPALLISAMIWWRASDKSLHVKPLAYALFGLAMLGTMASDSPTYYNTAIESICEIDNGRLITQYRADDFSSYDVTKTFVSDNGGLTWEQIDNIEFEGRCSDAESAQHPTITNALMYRWQRDSYSYQLSYFDNEQYDAYVERSDDNGETWIRIHDLDELAQDVREYGNQDPLTDFYTLEAAYQLSPVSGIVHSGTSNLVLAMSRDGALVITSSNEAIWVAVGDFQLDELQDTTLLDRALVAHYFLLPTLWFLVLVSVIVMIQGKRILTRLWLTIGWIHWAILVVTSHKVFETALGDNLGSTAAQVDNAMLWGASALLSAAMIAFPMVIWAGISLFKYKRAIVPIIVSAIVSSLAYALPIAMWTQGLIPRYRTAAIYAVILVACVLASCYVHYKDQLPAAYEVEKPKRKEKPKPALSE
ncbi:MAG: hypothetical protein WBC91_19275 [Phototrophicaceae bacterium]